MDWTYCSFNFLKTKINILSNLINIGETGKIYFNNDALGTTQVIKLRNTYSKPPIIIIGEEYYYENTDDALVSCHTSLMIRSVSTTEFKVMISERTTIKYSPSFDYVTICV